jgi:hypothetical protein
VAAADADLPEVMFANPAQITEPDVLGVVPHLINDFVQGSHTCMVSILIPYVNILASNGSICQLSGKE